MDPILYNAALKGDIKVFKNIEQLLISLLTPSGNTVLHIYITSLDKNSKSMTKFVKELLTMCPSLLWKTNANDETLLNLGARYGRIIITKFLIEQANTLSDQDLESGTDSRMKMLRMMDKEKNTVLHEAVRFGYLKVVKLLIHEDPGLSQFANEYGETTLYMAVARKFSHVASEIIQSTRELQVCGGPLGRTALHAATVWANTDQNGWTPLHLAAMERWGNLDVAKLLLEYDRDVAYMKDAKGKTPLHLAAYKSKASVMKLILSSCPDCCELVDESGWNVLHFIIKSPLHDKRERKIEEVLTNPLVTKLLNEKDIDGNTPLHHQSYTEDIEENLMDHRRVDKMALNKEKLTTYDIALSSARLPDAKTLDEAREYRKSLEHQVYITNKKKEKENQKKEELVKTAGVHLVVATLISPVTFAAGITLPGEFEGGNDQHPGFAFLRKSSAFKTFVVFYGISMVSSSCAIFIHLLLPFLSEAQSGSNFLNTALLLILVAMGTMVLAFATGIYVVLVHSLALAITTCFIIGLSFFIVIFLVFRKYDEAEYIIPWQGLRRIMVL